jgi:hypothetical protein
MCIIYAGISSNYGSPPGSNMTMIRALQGATLLRQYMASTPWARSSQGIPDSCVVNAIVQLGLHFTKDNW